MIQSHERFIAIAVGGRWIIFFRLVERDSFHVRGFSRKMESHIFLLFHSAVGILGMVAQAKFSGE